MNRGDTDNRGGFVLILALVLLGLLGAFISLATTAMRATRRIERRFTAECRVQRALDAGIAVGPARIASCGFEAFAVDGHLGTAAFHAVGRALEGNGYELRVTATVPEVKARGCELTLELQPAGDAFNSTVVDYRPFPASRSNAGPSGGKQRRRKW